MSFRRTSKTKWLYVNTNSNSVTLTNLAPNTRHDIRIQSVKWFSKSKWTKIKRIKTKKTPYKMDYAPKAKTKKHLIAIPNGGYVAVKAIVHIHENYRNKGKKREFGYRCYGGTFESKNSRELLNKLDIHVLPVIHNRAYKKKGKVKYKKVRCNVFKCRHDHIYGGDKFKSVEKDSTTVVTHKTNTSGYISIKYVITGSVVLTRSKTIKFKGFLK